MAAEEGQVIGCHSLQSWNDQLHKGNESKKLLVSYPVEIMVSVHALRSLIASLQSEAERENLDFTASWCGPCKFIAPFLAELAKKYPSVTFLKVDVDELKEVAADWGVEAMPTFIFLKEGKMVEKVVGAKKDELQQTVLKHMADSSSSSA